ncbi:MAG: hypothetical protein ACXIVQ_14545 [Acidimicrobiales bacterium]
MKTWSVLDKSLAAAAALVFVVVAVLGVVALRSDGTEEGRDGCRTATLDEPGLTSDDGPVDALRNFVQGRPEDFPVDDSWVVESDSDGVTVFTSANGGEFEVEVSDGVVRRYLSCPDD